MKTLNFVGCILLFILVFSSCKDKVKTSNIAENFDSERIPAQIELTLNVLAKDTNHYHYFDTLSHFYQNNKFKAVWIEKLQDSLFRNQLYNIFDSIVYEGLKPEYYYVDSLKYYLSLTDSAPVRDLYNIYARADLYLSNLLIGLWHDKVMGRTDPRVVLGMKYTLPYPNHPNFDLFSVIDKPNGIKQMQGYYPHDSDFWRYKQMLYKAFEVTDGAETVIDTIGIRKLKPGDSTTIIFALAKRLVELDLLPDSIMAEYEFSNIYDTRLSNCVRNFQRNSNLTDDGIIGKSTLKILNASHNDKIDEIRANIERLRWFGVELPRPYVRVNIPEFQLYMYYLDSFRVMNVCVGKGKERYYDQKLNRYVVSKSYIDKPLNHETPQVYSYIDAVILNPTWTVPSSIVGREMFSLIVRNPGYLIKNNYQVLRNGEVIDPYSINWKKLSPSNVPYTIRQNAGDDNSLGKIKFTFRNPFDVYMHDTPLKSKFKLNNRAVSHGCVRVQDPVALTGFVLQNNVKRKFDDVLIMMGKSPQDSLLAQKWREDTTSYKKVVTKTFPVRLEQRMIVFFDYRTIVFDAQGMPRFLNDVYDKNRSIIEAMDSK
ncbi:MAG: L,D-transpeptidase family protein [Bacteroidia bacterium]|nr:L,D-transpeptidase family protein [Bacteroidia bacterium]